MTKSRKPKYPLEDKEREDRIHFEIVVDANGVDEQIMGWYHYLQDAIRFPFSAVCDIERDMSPLSNGERAEVVGMADADDCAAEMFVKVKYDRSKKKTLAVPLMQLAPNDDVEGDTREAVEDWRYWIGRGYRI